MSKIADKLIQAITDTKEAILQKTTADLQAKQMEIQASVYQSQLAQQQQNAMTNLQGLYYSGTAVNTAPTNTLTWTGIGGVASGGYYNALMPSNQNIGMLYPQPAAYSPITSSVTLEFIVDMIFAAVQKALEEDMRRIIREELASKDVDEVSR